MKTLFAVLALTACGRPGITPSCPWMVDSSGDTSSVHVTGLGGQLRASTLEQVDKATGELTITLAVFRVDTNLTVSSLDLDSAASERFENGESQTILGIGNTPPGWTLSVDGVKDNATEQSYGWACEVTQ